MMAHNPPVSLFVVPALLLAGGCQNLARHAPEAPAAAPLAEEGKARSAGAATFAVAARDKAAAPAAQAPPLPVGSSTRKLIRTAQLVLEVERFEEAARRAAELAEARGGYVSDSQTEEGAPEHRQGRLTLRVPAERFGEAFAALRQLGRVRSESMGAEDVTKAYTDLETRLRVKRATALRLREILGNRTAKLSDVLEVERELARVTEEIEQAEGERRYYDQQVALSTIALTLQEPRPVVESSALAPLADALRNSVQLLAMSVAALVYAMAFALPWAAVAGLCWLVVRRVRGRRAMAAS